MKSQLDSLPSSRSEIDKKDCVCNIVEPRSSTIHRVVKFTLAAEVVSMSTAEDRQLCLRLLLEAILDSEP